MSENTSTSSAEVSAQELGTVVQQLQQETSDQLKQLTSVFEQVGVDEQEAEQKFNSVQASITNVFEALVTKAEQQKKQLLDKISETTSEIDRVGQQIGDAETPRSEVEAIMEDMPLRMRLATLENILANVNKTRELRVATLERVLGELRGLDLALEELGTDHGSAEDALIENAVDRELGDTDYTVSRIAKAEMEIARLQRVSASRADAVQSIGASITKLWHQMRLGTLQERSSIAPVFSDESNMADNPIIENLVPLLSNGDLVAVGVRKSTLQALEARRDALQTEMTFRENQVRQLQSQIEPLWRRLETSPEEQQALLSRCEEMTMLSAASLEILQTELERMTQLKKEKTASLIVKLRQEMKQLWDSMRIPFADRQAECSFAFGPWAGDAEGDAEIVLTAHEEALTSLQARFAEAEPILKATTKLATYFEQLNEFESKPKDPNRLKGRNSFRVLAHEEKMRKLKVKVIPKLSKKVLTACKKWTQSHDGAKFLIDGQPLSTMVRDGFIPSSMPESLQAPEVSLEASQAPVLAEESKEFLISGSEQESSSKPSLTVNVEEDEQVSEASSEAEHDSAAQDVIEISDVALEPASVEGQDEPQSAQMDQDQDSNSGEDAFCISETDEKQFVDAPTTPTKSLKPMVQTKKRIPATSRRPFTTRSRRPNAARPECKSARKAKAVARTPLSPRAQDSIDIVQANDENAVDKNSIVCLGKRQGQSQKLASAQVTEEGSQRSAAVAAEAQKLMDAGLHLAALECFTKAISDAQPGDDICSLYYGRSIVNARFQRYEEALKDSDEALKWTQRMNGVQLNC